MWHLIILQRGRNISILVGMPFRNNLKSKISPRCTLSRLVRIASQPYSNNSMNKLQLSEGESRKLHWTLSSGQLVQYLKRYLHMLKLEKTSYLTAIKPEWLRLLYKTYAVSSDKGQKSSTPTEESPVAKGENLPAPVEKMSNDEVVKVENERTELSQEKACAVDNGNEVEEDDITVNLGLVGGKVSENQPSRWCTNVSSTNAAMATRTRHLVSLIEKAESIQSKLKRIEDFVDHLKKHHEEAKQIAVKEDAIRKLLNIRSSCKDHTTLKVLREAFALLGYVDPLPNAGIRILSIDGGGMRGVVAIEMLKKLEELTGKKVYELFDFICGVSTGSILGACIGTPEGIGLENVRDLYMDFGLKLFTQNVFRGVSNLLWKTAYYDTSMFEAILKKNVGEVPLIQLNRCTPCPKLAFVSVVMNHPRVTPFVFRNYTLPVSRQSHYLGSCHYTLYESVRSSVAAPTMFEHYVLDGNVHQDGGILVNNPSALAIHEAKLLWPSSSIQCLVSLGLGRHAPPNVVASTKPSISPISWKVLIDRVLESATDTESVHSIMQDLLPRDSYFRFNPYLSEMIPLHENRLDKINRATEDTSAYIRKNEEKFEAAALKLCAPRRLTQRMHDYIDTKGKQFGFLNSKL